MKPLDDQTVEELQDILELMDDDDPKEVVEWLEKQLDDYEADVVQTMLHLRHGEE